MTRMQFQFRKIELTSETKEQITQLRWSAYYEKYQQLVQLKRLDWKRIDDISEHFGIYDGAQLISSLRLTAIQSEEQFFNIMQFPAEHEFSKTPCFALARAATLKTYGALQINMSLRAYVYDYFLKHYPESDTYIYGTTFANSQRLDFLRSLGYEMLSHSYQWTGCLDSTGKEVVIFRLHSSKVGDALEKIKESSSFQNLSHNHKALKPLQI